MANLGSRYKDLEANFEKYLISDREELFYELYKSRSESANYAVDLEKLKNNLHSKLSDLDKIMTTMEQNNVPSIFACLCSTEIDKLKADKLCDKFLDIFIGTLEEILRFLVIENFFHARLYSSEASMSHEYEQYIEKHKKTLCEAKELVSKCLVFSNKNTPNTKKVFNKIRKDQRNKFLLISNLRIVGYIMRSYFNWRKFKKLQYYLQDDPDLIISLNDCSKALSILERDFDLCKITQEIESNKIEQFFNENKWRVYAHMALNIMKGHLFYGLKNTSKAIDAFCDAMRLSYKINGVLKTINKNPDIPICKLFIGKIFGEKGLLLDSLIWHLDSLYDLSYLNRESVKTNEKLHEFTDLFKYEKAKDIINKELLLKFLNNVSPLIFKNETDRNWIKGYKSDLLCRIGYTLYILIGKAANQNIISKIGKWFEVSIRLDNNNSLALQNLSLTNPKVAEPENLRDILSSDNINASRKINFWSMFKLNQTQAFRCADARKEEMQHEILKSLLTSLDNILTVPHIFNKKITHKRRIDANSINKLLILRRWNSFTPIIPRPIDFSRHSGGSYFHGINRFPGGGYFLIWNNKGIVIDPGFDFIRNLYSAGYSIADIDAIAITHSHIDHINDFFSILTLIYERKDILKVIDPESSERKIDLFLSLGAMNSFLPWCSAQTKETVNRIYALPHTSTIKKTGDPKLQLDEYNLELEVIPAKHNEILSEEWAVGLKFHLPLNKKGKEFIIGITSDTSYDEMIIDKYKDCDIAVAHMGDINFKELIEYSGIDLQPDLFLNLVKPTSNEKELLRLKELALSLGSKAEQINNVDNISDLYKIILEKKEGDEKANQNHLGFIGINALADKIAKKRSSPRMLVISEFPEYLGSFRKRIAESLNKYYNKKICFTGDITLQIKIEYTRGKKEAKVLCNKCARDNDIEHKDAFYALDEIQETCVKASDESIAYYCNEHRIEPKESFINKITF